MREAEWLTGDDTELMAEVALNSPRASDRTNRLFVAAFWTWQAARLQEPGQADDCYKRAARMQEWAERGRFPKPGRPSRSRNVIFFNVDSAASVRHTASAPNDWVSGLDGVSAIQLHLLRDIFGNPFRPVAVDPDWLTPTVVDLARGVYDAKAFDRLPVLADALEDAGCGHPDVLAHCRGPGPHVRGCWVVDLVLGKT
jgi:hypothetical protein